MMLIKIQNEISNDRSNITRHLIEGDNGERCFLGVAPHKIALVTGPKRADNIGQGCLCERDVGHDTYCRELNSI